MLLGLENEFIFKLFASYAYEPGLVYTLLVSMMILSAFGLPFPEEVTLLAVGFLAYMGANPDLFPPPYPGAPYVHVTTASIIAFVAVFAADFLIYGIGRIAGPKVLAWKPIRKVLSENTMKKVEDWTRKYGAYACGIFRFTPGVRFPGHLACGILKFPVWKFALIDGIAALISVPTQIYLVAHYGGQILQGLQKFKLIVLGIAVVVALVLLYRHWRHRRRQRHQQTETNQVS